MAGACPFHFWRTQPSGFVFGLHFAHYLLPFYQPEKHRGRKERFLCYPGDRSGR